jgi:predicted DNA-binding protein (MmcQ/YjbR family)
MNIEELRSYCLAFKGVSESFPFDSDTLVFKVMDKMFLLVSLSSSLSFNVKCDPEVALRLREEYPCVQPGYHMSKKHWNTIRVDGSVPDKLLYSWIEDSYRLVAASLPRRIHQQLNTL